ncbi:divalent-cation tolerance protein CutA [Desulfonatronospira sp.]|uniref:divalent-cation tolerance protein CutA n=1 Tax=Desulfonatronospira sp. TaxID=1962951 RepID=UPI0025C51EAB|nr:divalent-cation tolerance protein CutA [Desulfonatronospira sp.]
MSKVFAYITAADMKEAENIGMALVENNLAACVNAFENMTAMFMWKGRMETAKEVVLLAKTREELKDRLVEKVLEVHSYECPCVVFVPIVGGHGEFLDWIDAETRKSL